MKQENIDKIVWGGLYRCKISNPCPKYNDRLNDQKYGTWIPVHYEYTNYEGKHKEGYGMVDTYQVPIDISFTNEGVPDGLGRYETLVFKLNRLKEGKYGDYVKDKTNDYYYSAYVELNDNNINDFELLGDLNDYQITKTPEYYDEENVLTHVQLYFEHAYPRGIDLVKKGADINIKNKINNIIYEQGYWIKEPRSVSDYTLKELQELEQKAIKENKQYDKERLDKFYKLNAKLEELEKEYNNYKKSLESKGE